MELLLIREKFTPNTTLGSLSINGTPQCKTLEDTVREVKIKNETAIPEGKYKIILDVSKKFGKLMPLLIDVPQFDGIRIHSGYDKEDTRGCIIVGYVWGDDCIYRSRVAFNDLMEKLMQASKAKEEIWISIESRK